jgi:hypothetical protein
VRAIALAVAVVLGVGGSALAEAPRAPEPRSIAEIDAARERALTSAYQPELPSGTTDRRGSGADPQRLEPVDRRGQSIDTRQRRAEETGPLGSLMTVLMWGLLIVMAGLLAFWLGDELMKREDNPEAGPDAEAAPDTDAVTAAIIARPLGDADELARRGEFAEAIHTLLLRTLEELVRSAAVRVERSHTSREILARMPLLADAREALSGLITAVELTHFGDEPANAADYERCRQQFHRFATAFRASGIAGAGAGAGAGRGRDARAVPA